MRLVQWNPTRSLVSPSWDMDRFCNNVNRETWESDTTWRPAADVMEEKDAYFVNVEVPGLEKDDIKISFENHVLTLSGERKLEHEEDNDNYRRIERSYGKFERSFRLPQEVKAEEIKANYKNGVLSVEIPKSERVLPKQIEIK